MIMSQIAANPPRQTSSVVHVRKHLLEADFVSVRHEAMRKPLQALHDRPFWIIHWKSTNVLLNVNGQEDWISINHIKAAMTLSSGL